MTEKPTDPTMNIWYESKRYNKTCLHICVSGIVRKHHNMVVKDTLVTLFIWPSFTKNLPQVKFYLFEKLVSRLSGARNMGMEATLTHCPNFNRPVKDLVYKDLLTRHNLFNRHLNVPWEQTDLIHLQTLFQLQVGVWVYETLDKILTEPDQMVE